MKKPPVEHYERFAQAFCQASEEAGKEQYLVPYFITGHPGSTLDDTIELALWLKERGMRPRQVQDFIPTPMAIATAMYHTGIDPLTGKSRLRRTGSPREAHDEGAALLLGPAALAARARGAAQGGPRRSHRRPHST